MRLLITASPTREPIDQVRYLSNRSSGRMGIALAAAGVEAGHDVTLLLGPTCLQPPPSCVVERFESAADLERLLSKHFPSCDMLIMAAAVADYRPIKIQPGKLPRQAGKILQLELEATPDLVAKVACQKKPSQKVIAFALEESEVPADLEERAAEKMRRKGVDAIIANPLATMDAADISPVLLKANGERRVPEGGAISKAAFAKWLVFQIESDV